MISFFRKRLGHRLIDVHTCVNDIELSHLMVAGTCKNCHDTMGVIYESKFPGKASFIYGINSKLQTFYTLVIFRPIFETISVIPDNIYFSQCPVLSEDSKFFYCSKVNTFK